MGRPKKNKDAETPQVKRLTLQEHQEINLKKHKERLEQKKDILESRSEEKFYCKNQDLLDELIKWRDSNEDPDKRVITENLCLIIQKIARKLTNHSNFSRYSSDIKDEMVSFSLYRALKGLKNYNFEFKNPFGYFTQVCWNSFLIVCGKRYKYLNLKRDLAKEQLSQLESIPDINQRKLYNDFIKQYLGELDTEGYDLPEDSTE